MHAIVVLLFTLDLLFVEAPPICIHVQLAMLDVTYHMQPSTFAGLQGYSFHVVENLLGSNVQLE